jgi:lipoate-protein ligase B
LQAQEKKLRVFMAKKRTKIKNGKRTHHGPGQQMGFGLIRVNKKMEF